MARLLHWDCGGFTGHFEAWLDLRTRGTGMPLLLRPVGYYLGGGGRSIPRVYGATAPGFHLGCVFFLQASRISFGETSGKLLDHAGMGWWSVCWRPPTHPRWGLGSEEIPIGQTDTDAVALEGAAGPSWRASRVTLSSSTPRTGGNPWQQHHHCHVPSWRSWLVPALRNLGAWWEIFGGRSGREASSFFFDPLLSSFASFVFSLLFF